MRIRLIIAGVLALSPTLASASETITYGYDAKGRLTQISHAGGPANGVNAAYAYDPADNRAQVTITGSSFDPAARRVVVTPLRGGTVIALPNP